MSEDLTSRLNQILPKVTSDEFLSGAGLGNEIAFYIFNYPPEEEVRVRNHIHFLIEHIPKHKPGLQVKHVNLLGFAVDHLKNRNLLEKSFKMQRERGDQHLLKQLETVLDPNKTKHMFAEMAKPEDHDLILVSGVGSVYPMLRAHKLLNNLPEVMGQTPLVMFYPGKYDGQYLRLFGKLSHSDLENPYYRAFKLVE
jgi:BREX protein BrxB